MIGIAAEVGPMKRLFFYGSLRRDEYNHQRFSKYLTHVADGYIRGAELIAGNGYPWILPTNDTSNIVLGEVYDLDDKWFQLIEGMELGAGYERKSVQVEHNDGDGIAFLEADAYFYCFPGDLEDYPRIASGDWSKR